MKYNIYHIWCEISSDFQLEPIYCPIDRSNPTWQHILYKHFTVFLYYIYMSTVFDIGNTSARERFNENLKEWVWLSRVCSLSYPSLCASLSPSALTELSECDSIENVPRFQTLRFNVQAHQSRPVIYWLKLWLCIHIKLLLPECSAAAGHPAQGKNLEAPCW